MGTLTKGRYLVLRGLLLLIYCTASVISKGKSCVCPCACVPTLGVYCAVSAFSRSVKEERQLLGAIPVVTHHLSRFLVHVWGLQILPSIQYSAGDPESHSYFRFPLFEHSLFTAQWSFCYWFIKPQLAPSSSYTLGLFLRLPLNRCQSSHSTKFLVVNKSITVTAL